MENTLENKAKFFSQYWGQKVLRTTDEIVSSMVNTPLTLNTPFMDLIIAGNGNYFLMLTPLHLISDEDAIEVAKRTNPDWQKYYVIKPVDTDYHTLVENDNQGFRDTLFFKDSIYSTDYSIDSDRIEHSLSYLRSKGYALPYNGLSVEQQVSRGWTVLKTKI